MKKSSGKSEKKFLDEVTTFFISNLSGGGGCLFFDLYFTNNQTYINAFALYYMYNIKKVATLFHP